MAFSKKDRANLTASSLIGYSRSAPDMVDAPKAQRQAWADGIVELANTLAAKIDAAYEESTVQPTSENK